MTQYKIQGLIAASFTPMLRDGSINPEPIREYSCYLISNNLAGAFINGTTGEGIMMTNRERKQIAEEWMNPGPCRLPIRNLTSCQIDQLRENLEEMRFFNTKEFIQTI